MKAPNSIEDILRILNIEIFDIACKDSKSSASLHKLVTHSLSLANSIGYNQGIRETIEKINNPNKQ